MSCVMEELCTLFIFAYDLLKMIFRSLFLKDFSIFKILYFQQLEHQLQSMNKWGKWQQNIINGIVGYITQPHERVTVHLGT